MLSKKAKYALKAMLALSEAGEDDLLQATEIAERQNIPKKFLDLILQELRVRGFIQSHRGKQGGYSLARPATQITVGQIVRVIDGPLAPIACASVTAYQPCDDCADVKTCRVRMVMREVRDAASAVLDHITLEEAAAGRTSKETRKAVLAR
jgi:Rrf2 family protein